MVYRQEDENERAATELLARLDAIQPPSSQKRQIGFAKKAGTSKVATPEQCQRIPLHAKKVPVLDLDKVIGLLNEEKASRLRELLSHLRTVRGSDVPFEQRFRLKAPAKHAAQIIESGLGRIITPAAAAKLNALQYFCVVEEKEKATATKITRLSFEAAEKRNEVSERLRPIYWPEEFLDTSDYVSDVELQSQAKLRQAVVKASHAAAYDLTAAYSQVPLDASFAFAVDDGTYIEITRMPYGVDAAAEVMNIITAAIAGCRETAKNPAKVETIVHIDNLIGLGSEQEVYAWKRMVQRRAKRANITLNDEPENAVNTVVPFCGVVADLSRKSIWLGPKFMAKLARSGRGVDQLGQISAKALCELQGRIVYAMAATGRNMISSFKEVCYVKVVKRLLTRINNMTVAERVNTVFKLPRSAVEGLVSLLARLKENEPRPVNVWDSSWAGADLCLYSDATLTGWGAVLCKPGLQPVAVGGRWAEATSFASINECESMAVAMALHTLREHISNARIHILVDNTSALRTLQDGGMRTRFQPRMLILALAVRRLLQRNNAVASFAYVASENNLADSPSRSFRDDVREVQEGDQRYRRWGQYARWGAGGGFPGVTSG